MKNTIAWINGLKTFGIIAVILGHMNNPFNEFIFSWHMPLFFMLAGFFIKINASLKELIIKDWERLMIPYFIFAALAIVVETLKRWALHRESLNYINELKNIVIWMDMEHLSNSYAFVLWFLPALFLAKLMFYIVKKYIKNVFFQCGIFVLLFWLSFNVQLPFALSNAMNSILWIFIGSVLFHVVSQDVQIRASKLNFKLMLFLPFIFMLGIYVYSGVPSLNMASLSYEHVIFNFLWAVSFVLLMICFFKGLDNRNLMGRFFDVWGSSTMLLFIFHPYTNNISSILVEKIQFGGWPLQLVISMSLLQLALVIKQRCSNRWIFKYV